MTHAATITLPPHGPSFCAPLYVFAVERVAPTTATRALWDAVDTTPVACAVCKHEFTVPEVIAISKLMFNAALSYEYEEASNG